jgi:DNA invertase Pin-like site-specific DNA recombinase
MSVTNSTRAIAYARSSDDKQEASCEQQRDWAARKATTLNLQLVGCHEDDGVPGDQLDRPGLEALCGELARYQKARRPVPILLLFDQDRLSRATSWATGAIMERLMSLGVERLITATEEVDLYDDGSRAIFGLKQDLSKRAYAKALSKNISRGMARLAAAGYWTGGTAPHGYRIAGEPRRRHLIPGPAEEVAVVQELFRIAAEGVLGTWGLARLANARGWPVPAASAFRQQGKEQPEWTAYTIGWILRQPVYLGVIRYGCRRKGKYHQAAEHEPIERRGPHQAKAPPLYRENCHKALIDRATWERVQAVVASRRIERHIGRKRPDDFAFSGKLVCDCCGGIMQGRHKDAFHGYVCSTWRNNRGCSRNSVSQAVLLDKVATLLVKELSTKATLKRLRAQLEAKQSGQGDMLEKAVQKGRQHVGELEQQLEGGGKRLLAISLDMVPKVEKELRQLERELETARTDLAEVERQAGQRQAQQYDIDALLSQLADLPKLLQEADTAQRTRVIQLAVDNIHLRFDVKVGPSGRKQSRWTGMKVQLRGDSRKLEMPVPTGKAYPAGCPRC